MAIVPLENFGLGGLNSDQPRESLSLEFFDQGLNMKSDDGSLQGVPKWDTDLTRARLYQIAGGATYPDEVKSMRPVSVSQWTKAGVEYLDLVTAGEDVNGDGVIYVSGGNKIPAVVKNQNLPHSFTYDESIGFNSFIFNEVSIFNPGTAGPMYNFDRTNYYPLPNWFGEPIGSPITAITQYDVYRVETVVGSDWSSVGGSTSVVVGEVFTASVDSADISALGSVKVMHPYTAARMTSYNGRLIAVNLKNDLNDGDLSNDINSPIEMAFSSSVTSIGSIFNLEWYADATNSAGNSFLTQTPGRIVDAKQVGEFLMVYKTDSVSRIQDVGDPLYLVGEVAFLDDGVLSADCIEDIGGNRHFVVGNYNLYIHAGGPDKKILSDRRIKKELYDRLPNSKEDRDLTFTFNDTSNNEVWICYRDKDENPIEPNKGCTVALVYNYEEDTFYKRSIPNLRSIIETEINGITEAFATSADVEPDSLNSGYLYSLSKTELEPDGYVQFTSRSMGMSEAVKTLSGIFPTSREEFNIQVQVSNTPKEPDMSLVEPRLFNPEVDYRLDYRKLGRFYTVRISMNGAVNPSLSLLKADIDQEGER
jgi:hypothetical protein